MLLGSLSMTVMAQDSILPQLKRCTKNAVMKLSTSLESGKSDQLVAQDYESLAKTLFVQGEYAKAKNYLLNALQAIQKTDNISVEMQQGKKIISVKQINPTTIELLFTDSQRMSFDFYGENIFRIFQDIND